MGNSNTHTHTHTHTRHRPIADLTEMDPTSPKPQPQPQQWPPRPTSTHGRILNRPLSDSDIRSSFTFIRELGRGQFGVTYLISPKSDPDKHFACKSISARRLLSRSAVEDVRREIQIMHHLTGHPNIVELKGTYEDRNAVYLVMEVCEGGELFDRIVARGCYSEKKAAELCREIVGAVRSCHELGVMHRDLKPENFLFLSKDEDSPLKATDFGLSTFFKPGMDTDLCGLC